jgi:hypothetical protein
LALLPPSDKGSRANTLGNLSCVELLEGNWQLATSLLRDPIAIFLELGEQRGLAEHLCVFAGAAAAEGHAIRAGRLWGAVEAVVDGAPLSQMEKAIEERYIRSARVELGEGRWAEECAVGHQWTREQAVDYALKQVATGTRQR